MRVALRTGQPVGDMCDALGINRFWPELVDALAEAAEALTPDTDPFGGEAGREARLARAARRMTRSGR